MKMNLNGIDVELTPKEFMELQALTEVQPFAEPKDMTFDDEMNLLGSLRHFRIVDTEMNSWGTLKITLQCDME